MSIVLAYEADRPADVAMLQEEVREGCLWLEKKNPMHCRRVEQCLGQIVAMPDAWWRSHSERPLGWWLCRFGIPGYAVFDYD